MTGESLRHRFDDVARLGVRTMQVALVGLMAYGAIAGEFGLVANAGMSLVVAFLPSLLRWRYGYVMSGALALWIAGAAFLHGVGALGPYETIPWYDQVTHTLSAMLVAGAGYTIVAAIDREHDGVEIPPQLRYVFIIIFVLAFGVLWEIAEFASGGLAGVIGGEAVLAQYGLEDIVLDLLFNTIGAVLIATWGTGYFRGLSRLAGRRIDRAEND